MYLAIPLCLTNQFSLHYRLVVDHPTELQYAQVRRYLSRLSKHAGTPINFRILPEHVVHLFLCDIDEMKSAELAAFAIVNKIPINLITQSLRMMKHVKRNNLKPSGLAKTSRIYYALQEHLREYQEEGRRKPIQKAFNIARGLLTYLDGTIGWYEKTTKPRRQTTRPCTGNAQPNVRTETTTGNAQPNVQTGTTTRNEAGTQTNSFDEILVPAETSQYIKMEGNGVIYIETPRGMVTITNRDRNTFINNNMFFEQPQPQQNAQITPPRLNPPF